MAIYLSCAHPELPIKGNLMHNLDLGWFSLGLEQGRMDEHPNSRQTDIQEIRRFLRRPEYMINTYRTSKFSVTARTYELEHQQTSQNAIIIDLLVKQKWHIQDLEEECEKLSALVISLSKDSVSSTANINTSVGSLPVDFKEEEMLHQLQAAMEIDERNSLLSNQA